MSWEPTLSYAVLVQDVNGYKENKSMFSYSSTFTSKYVLRGSLLTRLSHQEIEELRQHQTGNTPPFNFKVIGETSVKLHCEADDVRLLSYKQKEILLAINSTVDRFYAIDKLEWAEKLTEESTVYVNVPTLCTVAKGVVHYVGKLPGESGTKFGIELLVCKSITLSYIHGFLKLSLVNH